MPIDNLFAASPLISARLKSEVAGLKTIASASYLSSIDNLVAECDAAYVIPGAGDASTRASASVADEQQWVVSLAVAQTIDDTDIDTLELKLGGYAFNIITALNNHKLSADFLNMRFTGHGGLLYGDGYAEFPLFFTVKTAIKGAKL